MGTRGLPLSCMSRTLARQNKTLATTRRPSTTSLASSSLTLSSEAMQRAEVMSRMGQQVTRVLFCGQYFPAAQSYTREYLRKHPFIQVDEVPIEDVPNVIGNYHICVVKNMQMNSSVISRAKQMKLIMQFGVGMDGIDIDAATKQGVKVARIPGDSTGNAASCAEMAIYLMIGLLRNHKEIQNSIKLKKLGEPVGETLFGKTVFIMGFGSIGFELAKRLRPFGVRILSTKRSWTLHLQDSCQSDGSSAQNRTFDDLVDEKGSHDDTYKFASSADIIVCCLQLNHETDGIIDKSFFSSMKKGAYLVNIARGGLVKYDAVAHNLKSGHLRGLGIDVAWTEPFDPDDPILKFPNVLITPHVAGATEYSFRSMAKVVVDVSLQLHEGAPLTGIEFVN